MKEEKLRMGHVEIATPYRPLRGRRMKTSKAEGPVLKHVEQKDRSGCAIACVAMVAGKTYEEVRKVYLENFATDLGEAQITSVGNGAGIPHTVVEKLLKHLGVKGVTVVPFHGPIIRSVPGVFGSHFVVIDGTGRKLDPAWQFEEPPTQNANPPPTVPN